MYNITIDNEIVEKYRAIYNNPKYKHLEYGSYHVCTFKDGFNCEITDWFLPKQFVTSASIDFDNDDVGKKILKNRVPEGMYNTVIHKHPDGCIGFSGTDEKYINRGSTCSLLFVDNYIELGVLNFTSKTFRKMTGYDFIRIPDKYIAIRTTSRIDSEDISRELEEKIAINNFGFESNFKARSNRINPSSIECETEYENLFLKMEASKRNNNLSRDLEEETPYRRMINHFVSKKSDDVVLDTKKATLFKIVLSLKICPSVYSKVFKCEDIKSFNSKNGTFRNREANSLEHIFPIIIGEGEPSEDDIIEICTTRNIDKDTLLIFKEASMLSFYMVFHEDGFSVPIEIQPVFS